MGLLRTVGYNLLSSAPAVAFTDFVVRCIYEGKIPNRGRIIDTNAPTVSPWVRTLVFWDMYETAEMRLIQRYLPRNMDVIELGGSIGVVASQVAAFLDAGRRLISVEANPSLIELLARNISANGPAVRTTVVYGAIAYDRSRGNFVEMSFGDLTASMGAMGDHQHRVPRITLGDLVSQFQLDDFVLVADIEGGEAGLLTYDADVLTRCPLIIIELHETTLERRRVSIPGLVSMVEGLGYALKDRYRDVYAFARVSDNNANTD